MIKQLIRNIIFRERASSGKFVAHMKKLGVQVGKDVTVYSPTHSIIDLTNPSLLTIGDHVKITQGVIILTHDYAWSVLSRIPENKGRILGAQSPVRIGNNVYIGMNAVITRGVTIGDNVIIGTGSVVTHDCESNSVYAGVPARKIMTITEYLNKREALQFEEAKTLALEYRERFGVLPPQEIFCEYFMLFCDVESAKQCTAFCNQMKAVGDEADMEQYMQTHDPMFCNYQEFLNACFRSEPENTGSRAAVQ